MDWTSHSPKQHLIVDDSMKSSSQYLVVLIFKGGIVALHINCVFRLDKQQLRFDDQMKSSSRYIGAELFECEKVAFTRNGCSFVVVCLGLEYFHKVAPHSWRVSEKQHSQFMFKREEVALKNKWIQFCVDQSRVTKLLMNKMQQSMFQCGDIYVWKSSRQK